MSLHKKYDSNTQVLDYDGEQRESRSQWLKKNKNKNNKMGRVGRTCNLAVESLYGDQDSACNKLKRRTKPEKKTN